MTAAKSVFIMGAGFSTPAKIPMQWQLLPTLYKEFEGVSGILDIPESRLDLSAVHIDKYKRITKPLLDTIFDSKSPPRLEEVFTLFDGCIRERLSVGGVDWTVISSARRALAEILASLVTKQEITREIYKKYAGFLSWAKEESNKCNDPITVISLNWDNLLERLMARDVLGNDTEEVTAVDFDGKVRIRNRTQGNVKLLKIHGSVDWIRCMKCGVVQNLGKKLTKCVSCGFNPTIINEQNITNPDLYENYPEVVMLTPTYLKELGQYVMQVAWRGAFIELTQANNLIFVGYSFPEADYHLRQMLLRARKTSWKILVITKWSAHKANNDQLKKRYAEFFGGNKVEFYGAGVENMFRSKEKIHKAINS